MEEESWKGTERKGTEGCDRSVPYNDRIPDSGLLLRLMPRNVLVA
jgi:hypothetical protein